MVSERVVAKRQIGAFLGQENGANVVFLASVHGNEPAAVYALKKVFQALSNMQHVFAGEVAAFVGNLAAFENNMRYVDEDLNRIWRPAQMKALEKTPSFGIDKTSEEIERRELYNTLLPYLKDISKPLYIIDLHTTSSQSAPFAIMADTIRNREFALNFPVPIILGLEEMIEGAIIHYTCDLGARTMAFEAGQHDDPASTENHIAAIWISLVSAGCLKETDIPNYTQYPNRLKKITSGIPSIFETRFHYQIRENEGFRMRPGYVNFQPIRKGEVLADNFRGEVRCKENGNIFMPLYQAQGTDGYFRIRPVRFFWLKISEWLRRIGVGKIANILPGIHRNSANPFELVVNLRIARWFVLEMLYLLGYRKKRKKGNKLIVTRRKFDLDAP